MMNAIIVYEVYNREFDNCLLLKYSLEHFGIKTKIVYKMDLLSIKSTDEKTLLFVPNSYDDNDFQYYYYASGQKNALIINMQYEQVLSDDAHNIDAHTPKGRASKIYNLCWGKGFKAFLEKVNILPELSFVGGPLQLDFMRNEFKDFWISKDELINDYGLPQNKDWVLFISSFAYANNPLVAGASDRVYGKDNNTEFRNLSNDSRNEIIKWFTKYFEEGGDKIIIYRKHPMEKYDSALTNLANTQKGKFFLIDDYNIKQWIFSSDYILNWYSTSAAECVAAKKHFEIIRPIEVMPEKEVVIFKNARLITTYNDFFNIMSGVIKYDNYPFDIALIDEMYEINEKPAFEKIAFWASELIKKDTTILYIDKDYINSRKKYLSRTHIQAKYKIKKLYIYLNKRTGFKIKSSKLRNRFAVDDWEFQAGLNLYGENSNKIKKIVDDYYTNYQG